MIRIPKAQRLESYPERRQSHRDSAFQIAGIEPRSWGIGVITGAGAMAGLWALLYLALGGD